MKRHEEVEAGIRDLIGDGMYRAKLLEMVTTLQGDIGTLV